MHNAKISVSEPSDNCNVNYVLYKGDYYVSSENICMHKVDPETLETKEKVWTGGVRELGCGGTEAHLAGSRGIPPPEEFVCACSISQLGP